MQPKGTIQPKNIDISENISLNICCIWGSVLDSVGFNLLAKQKDAWNFGRTPPCCPLIFTTFNAQDEQYYFPCHDCPNHPPRYLYISLQLWDFSGKAKPWARWTERSSTGRFSLQLAQTLQRVDEFTNPGLLQWGSIRKNLWEFAFYSSRIPVSREAWGDASRVNGLARDHSTSAAMVYCSR